MLAVSPLNVPYVPIYPRTSLRSHPSLPTENSADAHLLRLHWNPVFGDLVGSPWVKPMAVSLLSAHAPAIGTGSQEHTSKRNEVAGFKGVFVNCTNDLPLVCPHGSLLAHAFNERALLLHLMWRYVYREARSRFFFFELC